MVGHQLSCVGLSQQGLICPGAEVHLYCVSEDIHLKVQVLFPGHRECGGQVGHSPTPSPFIQEELAYLLLSAQSTIHPDQYML